MKYGNFTLGQIEAMINRLGGEDAARNFLCGGLIAEGWRSRDGYVEFSVTSDGTTGPEWITRLSKGSRLPERMIEKLNSPDFVPTNGVTTKVVLIRGSLLENKEKLGLTLKNFKLVEDSVLTDPTLEVSCLIEAAVSKKVALVMNLWLITGHQLMRDSGGNPDVITANHIAKRDRETPLDQDVRKGSGWAFIVQKTAA